MSNDALIPEFDKITNDINESMPELEYEKINIYNSDDERVNNYHRIWLDPVPSSEPTHTITKYKLTNFHFIDEEISHLGYIYDNKLGFQIADAAYQYLLSKILKPEYIIFIMTVPFIRNEKTIVVTNNGSVLQYTTDASHVIHNATHDKRNVELSTYDINSIAHLVDLYYHSETITDNIDKTLTRDQLQEHDNLKNERFDYFVKMIVNAIDNIENKYISRDQCAQLSLVVSKKRKDNSGDVNSKKQKK